MKITDEQMKELIRFARDKDTSIEAAIKPFSIICDVELMILIGYEINRDLDQYYDTVEDNHIFLKRQDVLNLMAKWISSDASGRVDLESVLRCRTFAGWSPVTIASLASLCAAQLAALAVSSTNRWVLPSIITSSTKIFGHKRCKEIIIKTVLDYYGEDFQTFEALYL